MKEEKVLAWNRWKNGMKGGNWLILVYLGK